MSVKKSEKCSVNCCCQYRKNADATLDQVTAKLLYRIAFTIWHVAFHIENEQVGAFVLTDAQTKNCFAKATLLIYSIKLLNVSFKLAMKYILCHF